MSDRRTKVDPRTVHGKLLSNKSYFCQLGESLFGVET